MGGGLTATVFGVDSQVAYTGLVALIAVQRLVELGISRRHIRRLRARGGFEVGREHYPWMVAFHAAFLGFCVAEVWLLDRPWRPAIAMAALVALALAQALRLWTQQTLGDRWTTRVIALPGEPLIETGPFRRLRHPNYLVVVMEIAALPMVHCAWITALVGSAFNSWILRGRLQVEEKALLRSSVPRPPTGKEAG